MKKLLTIILSLAVAVTMCMPMSAMAEDTNASVSTADELRAAVANDSITNITLTKSIDLGDSLDSVIKIPEGRDITISGSTGNEKITISLKSSTSAQAPVNPGDEASALMQVKGTVTLQNIVLDAQDQMRVMAVNEGGNATLKSGSVITGGSIGQVSQGDNYGAGVVLNGKNQTTKAVLNIKNGAKIKDNYAAGKAQITGIGVGVFRYGTVNMEGGEISGNKDYTTGNYRYYSKGGGIGTYGIDSTVNISGGSITGNSAKLSGGGVELESGTANISGGTISNNTTKCSGGGVFNENCVTIISGGTITGNKASSDEQYSEWSSGGGMYVESSSAGSVSMTGGTISGNTAETLVSKDTDREAGQGGGVKVGGTFNMSGGTITGNSASSASGLKGNLGCGGGVSIIGGQDPGTFNYTGGSIYGNTASNKAAGVMVNNKATTSDRMYPANGGLSYDGAGIFNMSGRITCEGIYLKEGTNITVTDEIEDTSKVIIDTEVTKEGTVAAKAGDDYSISSVDARLMTNSAGKKIYDVQNGDIVISAEKASYTSIIGAVVTGIESSYTYTGTAIKPEPKVVLDGETLTEGKDYTVSYRSGDTYNNTDANAVSNKNGVVRIIGSGDYSDTIKKEFTIGEKALTDTMIAAISDRIYTGSSIEPAINASYNGTDLIEDKDYKVKYDNNGAVGTGKATVTGTGNYSGEVVKTFAIKSSEGKNIANTEAELTGFINAGETEIYVNSDITAEGTIAIPSGKTVKIIGNGNQLSIIKNSDITTAPYLFSVSGEVSFEGLTLTKAKDKSGGIIKINAGGSAVIGTGTAVSGGSASAGAGVYNSGTLTLNGGTIKSNIGNSQGQVSAGQFVKGVGIYNKGTAEIKNGSVSNNTGGGNGGGIYNASGATFTMTGGSVTGNEVSNYGGGIYNDGTFNLNGGTISGNTADKGNQNSIFGIGGGIYNIGNLTMTAGSIESNTSSDSAGGVFTGDEYSMSGGKVCNNSTVGDGSGKTANCGGGVFVYSGKFAMTGGEISGNTARSKIKTNTDHGVIACGGGVYVGNTGGSSSAVFALSGGTIKNNNASGLMDDGANGLGGGIYLQGGQNSDASEPLCPATLKMEGGTVTNNSAVNEGDGIYAAAKEIYYDDLKDTGASGKVTVEMQNNCKIKDNTADDAYLCDGVMLGISGVLTGDENSIGIASAGDGDAAVAQGINEYTFTANDESKLFASGDPRTVKYDSDNHAAYMEAIDIEGYDLSLSQTMFTYTGKECKPAVTVTDSTGKKLTENENYTVSYSGSGTVSKSLINAGDKTVTVSGKGMYSGEITTGYKITAADMSGVAAAISNQVYSGRALTPNPSSIKFNGITLLKNTDYSIAYSSNVKAGMAAATVKGIGNFSGSKNIRFVIYPGKGAISKLSKGKKAFSIKIKSQSAQNVSGYQIGYMIKGGKWKYTNTSSTKKTIKKLKKKKYYYVKVRAYKKIGSSKYYGRWSSSKKVKTK